MLSTFKGYTVTAPDGKSYEINAPEGTPESDLYEYVQSTYYPTNTTEGEVNKSARLIGTNEETVATRTLETVPGAREFLDERLRKGVSFDVARDEFLAKEEFKGIGFPEDAPKLWAENLAFGATPEGRKYFQENSGIAPVNRSTGIADPNTPDSMLEEFGASAQRSLANTANTMTGVAGLGADLVGADETAESLLDTYLEKQAAIQQAYPTGAGKAKDVESFSDAGMWAANTMGELLPQITSSMGIGLGGTAAAKEIAQRGVRDFVEDQVTKGATREAAEALAAKIVQKKALQGGVAATGASSVAQSSGSIYGDTYGQTGERMPWTSLFAGTAAGSLDTILPATVLKKISGVGTEVANTAVAQSLIKKVGKDAASAFLIEGGTEALQTIIEQLPAGKPINWDDVVETALKGGFGGSIVGGVAGNYEGNQQNTLANKANPPKSFEGDPISVPTTKGKKDGKTYLALIDKTQDEVIARVDQLTQNWENKPTFEVYKNFKDVDGVPDDSVGVYRDGKVILSTENIVAEAKKRGVAPDDIVSAVTYHEALGHYGLAQKFGDELDGTLATILENSTLYQKRVQDWMKKNPNAYKGRANRDILALEEILAERSEGGKMPASIVNIFKNKIKDFGRQMGLDLQYSTREVETILGMAHAAVVKGEGRDVRDNGFRFMYAGEKAKAPPKDWLDRPDESRWFSGPDGKPRFEFSDADASFNEDAFKKGVSTLYAPAALNHPELYKQYPSLKDTRIAVRDMGYNQMGSYNPTTNLITVATASPDKLGTILHEMQHNIQEIEDFARGGSPDMAVDAMSNDHVLETAKNLLKYNEKKYQELSVEIRAIEIAEEMPEGQNLIEEATVLSEIYREMYAIEKQMQDENNLLNEKRALKKPRLERKDFLENFEYSRLAEEFSGQLENVKLARDNLRKKLFPEGYWNATRQDQLEWNELVYVLEKGTDAIIQKEAQWEQAYNELMYLVKDIQNADIPMLRVHLNQSQYVPFQAYQSLLGEVEARDVQARQNMTMEERKSTAPYTSQNEIAPSSSYIISGVENKPKDALDKRAGVSQEMMSQENPGNRYMRMTKPDAVQFTPEEIDEMTPEELFDSENALNILEGMTKGYTPVVMSYDDLKQEAEARGLSPSKVLRNNGIGAGELVKRLYMYDIAMTKMNDRLSALWEKMQNGTFTVDDKQAYVRGVLKRDELAGRIFEDQSEVARALAALKTIQYTRRRVQGMQETLAQFSKDSPYAALNDPEVFYKFASQIQGQIEENQTKAKEAGKEFIGNALNLPRALMSSMDLSAPLRQGIFLIHKAAWWKSFFQMFRYAGDQKAYDDLMESITTRDTYDQMVKSKLALSNLGSKLSQREEDFMSTWAEKIPVVGRFVRGSERAYVGFLNKLRADVFDQLYSKLPPEATEQDLKDIAGFINAASGRGNMTESLNKAAPVLNALFFSPRLMASRFKMTTALVDPRTYISMNKTARNEYIKSILTVGGLALLINTLAAAGGAETEKDPRSSDFGKLKFGNTRYDILGGEGQYVTLLARLARNSYKTTDGQVKPYGIKYGQTNQLDAIGKFFTNKAAPIPSFVMDYFRGTDAVGKKFEMDEAIVSRFVPMYMADMKENIDEEGLPEGVAMSLPGLFGIGTQTYKPASTDTEEPLEAPDDFKMADAVDGEYPNATVKDGIVTLDAEAKKEWASRINFYYKEWMKDEMKAPTWKALPEKEKKAIIKEVRADARKEAKADMLDLLAIEEFEEEN